MKTLEAKKRDMEMSLDALRATGMVPAVVYGAGSETTSISVSENEIRKIWRHVMKTEAFTLNVDGSDMTVKIQELQTNPVSGIILHIDFMVQA